TLVFFFQAEDGIRDFHVTGVQTCALPISVNAELEDAPPFSLVLLARRLIGAGSVTALDLKSLQAAGATTVGDALRLSPEVLILRSEERRVGEDCRKSWTELDHEIEKAWCR